MVGYSKNISASEDEETMPNTTILVVEDEEALLEGITTVWNLRVTM